MKKLLIPFLALAMYLATPATTSSADASAIDARYNSEPALRQLLGAPIDAEWSTHGGRMREYQNGALYYTPQTGVHEVDGVIRWEYKAHGGLDVFGWPTTDKQDVLVRDISIGQENLFQYGDVVNDPRTSTHWMDQYLSAAWHENVYPYLNMPTHDQQPEGNGSVLYFYGAAIHEAADHSITVDLPSWVNS